MSTRRICFRHAPTVWIASCDDCCAWHLPRALSRKAAQSRSDVPTTTADVVLLTPAAAGRPMSVTAAA